MSYQPIPQTPQNVVDNWDTSGTPTSAHTHFPSMWPFHGSTHESEPVFRAATNRIICRDGDFHQSGGKIAVRKRITRHDWQALYSHDWFHSLVDAPTHRVVIMMLLLYFGLISFFACLYLLISRNYGCNMGIMNFLEAFIFSLETCATVGYGTQDIFFEDCLSPSFVISLQLGLNLFVEAFVIGVTYCRLARPHSRASTLVFSNKAVIRRIRGRLYFMFQLCELRKHQLGECHIRVYVVRHEKINNEEMAGEYHLFSSSSADKDCTEDSGDSYSKSTSRKNIYNTKSTDLGISPIRATIQKQKQKQAVSGSSSAYPQRLRDTVPPSQHPSLQPEHASGSDCGSDSDYDELIGDVSGSTQRQAVSPLPARFQHVNGDIEMQGRNDNNDSAMSYQQLNSSLRAKEGDHLTTTTAAAATGKAASASNSEIDNNPNANPPPDLAAKSKPRRSSAGGIPTCIQTCTMRLNHPNDELGGMLLLLLPQTAVHELDQFSPLMPPPYWIANYHTSIGTRPPRQVPGSTSVPPRVDDASHDAHRVGTRVHWQPPVYDHLLLKNRTASMDDMEPPPPMMYDPETLNSINFPAVTGRDAGSFHLHLDWEHPHHKMTSSAHRFAAAHSTGGKTNADGTPVAPLRRGQHRNDELLSGQTPAAERRRFDEENRMVQAFMADRKMEVIAIVEGTDPTTGGAVQARHSYTWDEIEWNHTFSNCIYEDPVDGCATVDFTKFHDLERADLDVAYAGAVSSIL